MKHTAELTFAPRSALGEMSGAVIADLARRAERSGFDAVAFNEHPVPSAKWLDAGGHDAFDPLTALAFCAAVTERMRLMAYTLNVTYRNPFVSAKGVSTIDVLSGGRTIVCAGIGYLRSEFAALGVAFEDRNTIFDEAIDAMLAIWGAEPVVRQSPRFTSVAQVSTPSPVQRPHPPIWLAGNGPRVRRRVAKYGQGWTPLMTGEVGARTARTTPIPDVGALASGIADLRRCLEEAGREPDSVEIQVQTPQSVLCMNNEFDAEAHLDFLGQLAGLGVTQYIVHLVIGDGRRADDAIDRYAESIIDR